ncbi:hypothetical protein [Bosea sp. 124]|uniref:hypothetical protein n=1 Tax=Bosea sp. 124 TaxID=2135642 RepID=UPI000D360204|nr:hypothetical protein [Bosea sp. 124]PTM43297.1 hypothetical protein C8D03_4911 [Bosea sp. 124]
MSGSVFTAAAGFLRGVGNQAAVSVAASAIAAALLALPAGFSLSVFGGTAEQGDAGRNAAEGWVSPVASDGKIRERHHDAAAGGDAAMPARDGQGLVGPAAIVMPMALAWTQPAADVAVAQQARPAPVAEPRIRTQQAQALPPRRPAIERPLAERTAAVAELAPLQVARSAVQIAERLPATDAAMPQQQRSLLGVTMPAPVSRVGDAVSGAVGLVGAAGSWTLSRASDLLPRL